MTLQGVSLDSSLSTFLLLANEVEERERSFPSRGFRSPIVDRSNTPSTRVNVEATKGFEDVGRTQAEGNYRSVTHRRWKKDHQKRVVKR